MSVEVHSYVKIILKSLPDPIMIPLNEAMELKNILIKTFPEKSKLTTVPSSSQTDKWVLVKKSWHYRTQMVSNVAVNDVLDHISEDWITVDYLCGIVNYGKRTILYAMRVLNQEGKIRVRGRGKTKKIQLRTEKYTPSHDDRPKIDIDNGNINHNLEALRKDTELRRRQMREG